jgi:hypothetical protein
VVRGGELGRPVGSLAVSESQSSPSRRLQATAQASEVGTFGSSRWRTGGPPRAASTTARGGRHSAGGMPGAHRDSPDAAVTDVDVKLTRPRARASRRASRVRANSSRVGAGAQGALLEPDDEFASGQSAIV